MDKFLNFLKKFSKWIAVVVISFLLLIYVISEINQWRDSIASTIDEEVALKCPANESTFVRAILGSSPKSRATNNYWKNIKVLSSDDSEIFEDKRTSFFREFDVIGRDIDYVTGKFETIMTPLYVKINRENYNLKILHGDETPYDVACEVVDAKDIYDYVDKTNRESQERNIL